MYGLFLCAQADSSFLDRQQNKSIWHFTPNALFVSMETCGAFENFSERRKKDSANVDDFQKWAWSRKIHYKQFDK